VQQDQRQCAVMRCIVGSGSASASTADLCRSVHAGLISRLTAIDSVGGQAAGTLRPLCVAQHASHFMPGHDHRGGGRQGTQAGVVVWQCNSCRSSSPLWSRWLFAWNVWSRKCTALTDWWVSVLSPLSSVLSVPCVLVSWVRFTKARHSRAIRAEGYAFTYQAVSLEPRICSRG